MHFPLRGVNLGGWLVTEYWIEPQPLEAYGVIDELALASAVDRENLKTILTDHRETFITEKDFAEIAKHGFNSVRLPVPWYLFEGSHQRKKSLPSIEYVDRAMEWAHKYGLSVLIDLHVVPGSQNGFDSSYGYGKIGWHKEDVNSLIALNVIERIAKRYKNSPALFGIELLNEPVVRRFQGLRIIPGLPMHTLRKYYKAGYQAIRRHCDSNVAVVLHDAFRPQAWGHFMSRKKYENVWMDLHRYHCYTPEEAEIYKGHRLRDALREDVKAIELASRGNKKVMIGEWSAGLNIPVKALSPEARSAFERKFVLEQLKTFSRADGWYFWTYKTRYELFGWDSRKALAFLDKNKIRR